MAREVREGKVLIGSGDDVSVAFPELVKIVNAENLRSEGGIAHKLMTELYDLCLLEDGTLAASVPQGKILIFGSPFRDESRGVLVRNFVMPNCAYASICCVRGLLLGVGAEADPADASPQVYRVWRLRAWRLTDGASAQTAVLSTWPRACPDPTDVCVANDRMVIASHDGGSIHEFAVSRDFDAQLAIMSEL